VTFVYIFVVFTMSYLLRGISGPIFFLFTDDYFPIKWIMVRLRRPLYFPSFLNGLAYWNNYINFLLNCIELAPGGCNSQHFIDFVNYKLSQKARGFVPGMLLRPSLMFVGKSRSRMEQL